MKALTRLLSTAALALLCAPVSVAVGMMPGAAATLYLGAPDWLCLVTGVMAFAAAPLLLEWNASRPPRAWRHRQSAGPPSTRV